MSKLFWRAGQFFRLRMQLFLPNYGQHVGRSVKMCPQSELMENQTWRQQIPSNWLLKWLRRLSRIILCPRANSTLIQAVHSAVERLGKGSEIVPTPVERKEPAVPIRRSVTPDYLVCLEDGKRYKSLRRHLAGLGLTPAQYREKWNLPPDYPMVAPNYAALRSAMAKKLGLGQIPRKAGARKSGGRPQAAKI